MNGLVKKINGILSDKAERLVTAFEHGNAEDFVKEFQLDTVSNYYMSRWFHGYAVNVETPKKVTLDILDINPVTNSVFWCHTKLCMIYEKSYDEEVDFNWKVIYKGEDETLRITETTMELKQPDWKENLKEIDLAQVRKNLEQIKDKTIPNRINWAEVTVDQTDLGGENIPASVFSRAVAKSVRYRNTHPQIDSAAILADMMSLRMARFAFEMKELDVIGMLEMINSYAKKYFKTKTYDEFKEEGMSEYSPKELSLLPLYSIDETLNESRSKDITEVSCVNLASFYVGLLRLGGVDPFSVFVVIQPFHYLTVLEHENKYFTVSSNEVYPMTTERLYGDTEVVRIVSPSYYIDKNGEATVSEEEYHNIEQIFHKGIPIFILPQYKKGCSKWPNDMNELLRIQNYTSPEAYHRAIVEFVKEKDRTYPNSVYTWALYAYQTLLVTKPQAYLIWSIHSQDAVKFSKEIQSIDMLLDWMKENLDEGSIFEEEERIMTADQVLRNKKGGSKDKGVLFYTIIKLLYPAKTGGILLTDRNECYVEIEENGKCSVYDMDICETKELDTTNVLLYFNDKKVRYNYTCG